MHVPNDYKNNVVNFSLIKHVAFYFDAYMRETIRFSELTTLMKGFFKLVESIVSDITLVKVNHL